MGSFSRFLIVIPPDSNAGDRSHAKRETANDASTGRSSDDSGANSRPNGDTDAAANESSIGLKAGNSSNDGESTAQKMLHEDQFGLETGCSSNDNLNNSATASASLAIKSITSQPKLQECQDRHDTSELKPIATSRSGASLVSASGESSKEQPTDQKSSLNEKTFDFSKSTKEQSLQISNSSATLKNDDDLVPSATENAAKRESLHEFFLEASNFEQVNKREM